MIDAIDCQGLGGGMTLGFVQTGCVNLVRKVEQTGAFGMAQCNDNRHLLGDNWDFYSGPASEWEPKNVPLVFGNPPCSGFSMMSVRAGSKTRRDYRGPQAAINSCMWDLVEYAAECNAQMVVMESVPTAGKEGGKGGRSLMQALRAYIETRTGEKYSLHHCFHNGAALGGSSVRRRYFMVLSRGPFGVFVPQIERVATMRDVIGDLPQGDTSPAFWSDHLYDNEGSFWSKPRRNPSSVDGHTTFFDQFENAHGRRLQAVLDLKQWGEGDQMVDVLQRYYEKHGRFPMGWTEKDIEPVLTRPTLKAADHAAVLAGEMTEEAFCTKWGVVDFPANPPKAFQGGAYQPKRWHADRAGRVMAGNAMTDLIHPWHNRTFTYRECARVMGFPDAWNIDTYAANRGGAAVFGKGVLVDSGKWIGSSAVESLLNSNADDLMAGELIGEREFLIDISNIHRDIYNERTGERSARV